MDLSCVFIMSKYGDALISKDYLFDGLLGKVAPDFRHRVLNEINGGIEDDDDDDDDDAKRLPDDKPYFSLHGATIYFISRNDVYFVTCRSSSSSSRSFSPPPIVALDFLTRLFKLICVICRVSSPDFLDARRLLTHQIVVLEILDEVAAKGQTQVASADKIKNLIYSPPPPSASSAVEISSSPSTSIQKLAKFLPNASSILVAPQLTSQLTSQFTSQIANKFDSGLFTTAYSGIPSALRHAVSSLAATARQASSDGDVFVDVVERVSLQVDAEGRIDVFRLQGQLFVETRFKKWGRGGGGRGNVEVPKIKLFLPEDAILESKETTTTATSSSSSSSSSYDPSAADVGDGLGQVSGRAYTGSTTVLTNCVFHPFCGLVDKERVEGSARKPEMIVNAANGEKIVALSYQVPRDAMKLPPPLHVDLTVGKPSLWKSNFCSATVSMVLTSRMPPPTNAASIKVSLPVPDYIDEATRLTANLPYIQGVEQSMEFDRKKCRVVWSIRHLPGRSSVELAIRLTWQSPKNILAPASSSSSSSLSSSAKKEENEDVSSSIPSALPPPPSFSSSSSSSSRMISSSSLSSSSSSSSYKIDVGPAFLEFELSGFSQSGFRIEALKFVDSTTAFASTARIKKETENVNRWLRYITLDGNVYSFATARQTSNSSRDFNGDMDRKRE